MINLIVEDYCQNCPDFKPKSESYSYNMYTAGKGVVEVITQTDVRCKYETRCHGMYERIKTEVEKCQEDQTPGSPISEKQI